MRLALQKLVADAARVDPSFQMPRDLVHRYNLINVFPQLVRDRETDGEGADEELNMSKRRRQV